MHTHIHTCTHTHIHTSACVPESRNVHEKLQNTQDCKNTQEIATCKSFSTKSTNTARSCLVLTVIMSPQNVSTAQRCTCGEGVGVSEAVQQNDPRTQATPSFTQTHTCVYVFPQKRHSKTQSQTQARRLKTQLACNCPPTIFPAQT